MNKSSTSTKASKDLDPASKFICIGRSFIATFLEVTRQHSSFFSQTVTPQLILSTLPLNIVFIFLGSLPKIAVSLSMTHFVCSVSSSLQIISRRSAQPGMDIPTHAPMCRFPSDTSVKMMCRAQGYHGRSRAQFALTLHPLTPHCCCLLSRITPATHRRHIYPSTPSTLRHHKHPGALWHHSSLFIPLSQPERHLNSRKVRMKCLAGRISAKVTSVWVNVYSEYQRDEWLLLPQDALRIFCI